MSIKIEDQKPLTGLTALEARLAQDMSWLEIPAKNWLPSLRHEGSPVVDVAVIGGGMAGLTVATALKHIGIESQIFDRAPEGQEGPWVTTARMETLRSPKQLTGPALGLPALTFRAWFESQFGQLAWEELDKIPRTQWMDYLRWYRKVNGVSIKNEHHVLKVVPRNDKLVELLVQTPAGPATVLARRLIIASGRDGLGGPQLPEIVKSLPRHVWAHSSDALDYNTLKGKRVGLIGAGASAMDSAATALEAGAASVDLLIRRSDLPRINKGKGSGNPGLTHGHQNLTDEWKWQIRHYINTQQVPPPRGSTMRVSRNENARFNFGCSLDRIEVKDSVIHVFTPRGKFEFDFLIFSTGFKIDWTTRPEYSLIAPHIRSWKDRFVAPKGQEDQELADSPDLGSSFEFQEKSPGECLGLSRIHCFCYPAALSHGTVSGDIPAISEGAKRLAQGMASLFYSEDINYHYERIQAFEEPELLGDEWTPTEFKEKA